MQGEATTGTDPANTTANFISISSERSERGEEDAGKKV